MVTLRIHKCSKISVTILKRYFSVRKKTKNYLIQKRDEMKKFFTKTMDILAFNLPDNDWLLVVI